MKHLTWDDMVGSLNGLAKTLETLASQYELDSFHPNMMVESQVYCKGKSEAFTNAARWLRMEIE